MIRCAGRTLDGQASVHSNAAWHRHAALSPSAQSRRPRRRRRLLQHPLRVREGGGPDVGVVGGRDRTRREAESALDAVLEPLVPVDPGWKLGGPGNSLVRSMGCAGGNRSATTSCRRRGRRPRGSWPWVRRHAPLVQIGEACHAREPFRPFTRTPQVPHDAWKARMPDGERRIAMDLDPSEGIQDRARGFDLGREGVEPEAAVEPNRKMRKSR